MQPAESANIWRFGTEDFGFDFNGTYASIGLTALVLPLMYVTIFGSQTSAAWKTWTRFAATVAAAWGAIKLVS